MNYLKKIHDWSKALAEVGISLIALGIVLEVLFKGQGVPFWPQIHVIENVQNIVAGFSAQGLVGLEPYPFVSRNKGRLVRGLIPAIGLRAGLAGLDRP